MHWRVQLLLVILILLAAGLGYLQFTKSDRVSREAAQISLGDASDEDSEPTAEQQAEIQFAKLLAVPLSLDDQDAATSAATLEFITQYQPGFVVLFGSSIATESAEQVISQIIVDDESPLVFTDHEGGSVQRLSGRGYTRLPSWRRLCQMSSIQRQTLLASSAAELKKSGLDGVLAPVVDVASNSAVLRERACSGDPELVAAAAADFVSVFEAAGLASVIKHYPGIGSINRDPHDNPAVVTVRPADTAPFYAVLDRWPDMAVMSSHAGVNNQTADVACSLSPICVGQIFELYPEAFVMTDALEMVAARYNPAAPTVPRTLGSVAIQAIRSGNHALLFGPSVTSDELWQVLESIRTEYLNSFEFREQVDAALAKNEQYHAQWRDL